MPIRLLGGEEDARPAGVRREGIDPPLGMKKQLLGLAAPIPAHGEEALAPFRLEEKRSRRPSGSSAPRTCLPRR